jgi:hypothetical protein|uniref:Uncharacterized protein n=1 Tax=Siphoviridae sp. cteLh2 TaxID=2825590 RepID=A0A8S5U5V9_9CAUD|nr:hypothetical protein [uncultured Lachnoclostridium sp.]DAF89842.1 MAG TPA: hypothetical protein [Siphoviridae sp. cteLh2]
MEEVKFEKIHPIVKKLFHSFIDNSKILSKENELTKNEQLLMLMVFHEILRDSLEKQLGKAEFKSIKEQINML